jgi:hypothetical protein
MDQLGAGVRGVCVVHKRSLHHAQCCSHQLIAVWFALCLHVCAGQGEDGQLGNGRAADSAVPVAVSGGLSFTHVATADAVVYGLQANGSAWSWGKQSGGLTD